jgi:glucose-1-phosphate cytidylyltransferase
MKTVLLCGGKGTRLREYTEKTPKPLVDVGGHPILWHLMRYYSHFGFDDFIVCAGYLHERIAEYCADKNGFDNIQCVDTGVDTLKSDRIKQIRHLIPEGEDFLVAYGDDLSDVPIDKLMSFHKEQGKVATLTAVRPISQFGILNIQNSLVSSFIEKPVLDHWINGGFFIFKYDIFNYLDQGELEKGVLPHLATKHQVAAYQHEGFWKCMNTFQDTIEMNELCNNNFAPWQVWEKHNAT